MCPPTGRRCCSLRHRRFPRLWSSFPVGPALYLSLQPVIDLIHRIDYIQSGPYVQSSVAVHILLHEFQPRRASTPAPSVTYVYLSDVNRET